MHGWEGLDFLEEIPVNLVATFRDAGSSQRLVHQFDADLTTRFTNETAHTRNSACHRLLVPAPTPHFLSVSY